MRKPDSLRAAIEAAVPDLARNPAQLKIWLDKGSVQACGRGEPVSLAYRYKLSLLVLDFAASEPHTLFAAIITWLSREQPDALLRPLDPASGIAFEIDVLDDGKVDVLVTMQLDEAAIDSTDGTIASRPEPPLESNAPLFP